MGAAVSVHSKGVGGDRWSGGGVVDRKASAPHRKGSIA
jgi:hypothetical protein